MLGAGTRAAPTRADPGQGRLLLDLTRLVSRADRPTPTGVDRVERAYLAACLAQPIPMHALVRLATGVALLDRRGTAALTSHLDRITPWQSQDMAARLSRRLSPLRRHAEATVRALACDHAVRRGQGQDTARLMARAGLAGARYFNVGHSNLGAGHLAALRAAGVRVHVMVHDTIPRDHPELQRPGTPQRFDQLLSAVAAHASVVLCPSMDTAQRLHGALGRTAAQILCAPLGVPTPQPDRRALPPGLLPRRPYLVALGTLEPRKRPGLLLDTWDILAAEGHPPVLYLVGQRGWESAAFFDRLDQHPLRGQAIIETGPLPDGAIAALLSGAAALISPSVAEGFGLPPAEATALGTPCVLYDLPVYREILGDNPVYVGSSDPYHWAKAIRAVIAKREEADRHPHQRAALPLPTWEAHFKIVLSTT